ncbi:MAG: hypothetical protein WD850_02565 [Candidatus Spechtbacterales bacterium]
MMQLRVWLDQEAAAEERERPGRFLEGYIEGAGPEAQERFLMQTDPASGHMYFTVPLGFVVVPDDVGLFIYRGLDHYSVEGRVKAGTFPDFAYRIGKVDVAVQTVGGGKEQRVCLSSPSMEELMINCNRLFAWYVYARWMGGAADPLGEWFGEEERARL